MAWNNNQTNNWQNQPTDKNFSPNWQSSWAGFDEGAIKRKLFVQEAKRWEGINSLLLENGQFFQGLRQALENKANGESWSMAFINFCLEASDKEFSACFNALGTKNKIFRSDHILTSFNNSPAQQISEPEPGAIVVWQMWNGDKASMSGQAAIITEVMAPNSIRTIEAAFENDVQAIFSREHFISFQGPMRVKGFLRPW